MHAAAIEVEIGHACHRSNDKIDDALFVLVPGGLGCIVKVAGQHRCNEQHRINDVFHLERQERQRHQCDAQHKNQAGTAGLALGKCTVHRKFAAMVVRKFIVKNRIHQGREDKSQQECQGIHTALSHDRKQPFDHIQSSSFFTCL